VLRVVSTRKQSARTRSLADLPYGGLGRLTKMRFSRHVNRGLRSQAEKCFMNRWQSLIAEPHGSGRWGGHPSSAAMDCSYRLTVRNDAKRVGLVGAAPFVQQRPRHSGSDTNLCLARRRRQHGITTLRSVSWRCIFQGVPDRSLKKMPSAPRGRLRGLRRDIAGIGVGWVITAGFAAIVHHRPVLGPYRLQQFLVTPKSMGNGRYLSGNTNSLRQAWELL
jgi:hypothetical protein